MAIYDQKHSNRISLTLSWDAYNTISNDISLFQDDYNFDGFINRIIENYYQDSEASISIAIKNKRQKYLKLLGNMENSQTLIDTLIKEHTNDLVQKMNSFPGGVTKKVRINERNAKSFSIGNPNFKESDYYSRGDSRYFKALLEDYSRQSLPTRERIYYKDIWDSIEQAITYNKQLIISVKSPTQEEKQFSVRPYKIICSPRSNYNYLVAFNSDTTLGQDPFVRRISRLSNAKCDFKTPNNISKTEMNYCDEMIKDRGVEYLSYENILTKVLLNKDGLKMYKNILYQRPKLYMDSNLVQGTPYNENYSIYYFYCPEQQIINYFLKFCGNAVIIEPINLRESFIKIYESAVNTYNSLTVQ